MPSYGCYGLTEPSAAPSWGETFVVGLDFLGFFEFFFFPLSFFFSGLSCDRRFSADSSGPLEKRTKKANIPATHTRHRHFQRRVVVLDYPIFKHESDCLVRYRQEGQHTTLQVIFSVSHDEVDDGVAALQNRPQLSIGTHTSLFGTHSRLLLTVFDFPGFLSRLRHSHLFFYTLWLVVGLGQSRFLSRSPTLHGPSKDLTRSVLRGPTKQQCSSRLEVASRYHHGQKDRLVHYLLLLSGLGLLQCFCAESTNLHQKHKHALSIAWCHWLNNSYSRISRGEVCLTCMVPMRRTYPTCPEGAFGLIDSRDRCSRSQSVIVIYRSPNDWTQTHTAVPSAAVQVSHQLSQ